LEKKEDNENFDKIKVFSSDDEKLKILGELLSNKSSRDIIRMLIEKEMYTNEIATKLDMRVNLVIHHLKKMKEIGIIEINHKKIIRKGKEHEYFRIVPGFLILPNETKENTQKNKTLKKIFKEGIKYTIVLVATVSSFLGISSINIKNITQDNMDTVTSGGIDEVPIIEIDPYVYGIIVFVCCIFLVWYSKK